MPGRPTPNGGQSDAGTRREHFPAETIGRALSLRAERTPERLVFRFLEPSGRGQHIARVDELDFAGLRRRALQVAGDLRARCEPGDRVMLVLPPGLD